MHKAHDTNWSIKSQAGGRKGEESYCPHQSFGHFIFLSIVHMYYFFHSCKFIKSQLSLFPFLGVKEDQFS
jgi:hypothetical protein